MSDLLWVGLVVVAVVVVIVVDELASRAEARAAQLDERAATRRLLREIERH